LIMMSRSIRCVLYPNKRDAPKEVARLINVPPTLEQFLETATSKLQMTSPAKKAFTENGALVDDVSLIREDEKIFISGGESFWKYDDSKVRTYKVAVLGAGGVGKSCLSLRYVKNSFVDVYDPTIEDAFRHQTVIDGATCMLDILDTAGQEDMRMLRRQWVQDRDGFMLVYSMTDKRSFEELDHFLNLIKSLKPGKQVPLAIVANKSDLKEARVVSEAEGKQMANINGGVYIEASARLGENITESFEVLIRRWNEVDGSSGLPPLPKKKSCTIL